MKELTEEQYFRKLKKILTKELPKGLRVVYDSHQLRLFVIRDGFGFIDKGTPNTGTSWHGVCSPVNEPDGTQGHVKEAVVGCVDITMEAVIENGGNY